MDRVMSEGQGLLVKVYDLGYGLRLGLRVYELGLGVMGQCYEFGLGLSVRVRVYQSGFMVRLWVRVIGQVEDLGFMSQVQWLWVSFRTYGLVL